MATATSRNIFYYVDDVMDLLGVSRSKAYKIIQDLNAELMLDCRSCKKRPACAPSIWVW